MATNSGMFSSLVDCPVCLTPNGVPKVLNCGHTVCEICLDQIVEGRRLKCPVCRSQAVLMDGQVSTLPTNIIYKQMREKHHTISLACQVCKDVNNESVSYCEICSLKMCRKCGERHTKYPMFAGHPLFDKDEVLCKKHEGLITHFCSKCNTLLCVSCIMADICYLHPVKPLSEIESEKRHELDQLEHEIKEKLDTTSVVEGIDDERCKNYIEQGTTLQNEVSEEAEKAVQEIYRQRDEFISEIKKWQTDSSKFIASQRERKLYRMRLMNLLKRISAAKEYGNKYTTVTLPVEIKTKLLPNEPVSRKLFSGGWKVPVFETHLRQPLGKISYKSYKRDFQIFVKTLLGKCITITANEIDKFEYIYELISQKEGIPVQNFYLTYGGRRYDGKDKVMEVGIQKGSTLYMHMRFHGKIMNDDSNISEEENEKNDKKDDSNCNDSCQLDDVQDYLL